MNPVLRAGRARPLSAPQGAPSLRAGFTLVETVVAVAVAAVAMAIAAAAVAGGHRLVGRIAAAGPPFDDALARQAALETLRMDLASALPSSGFPFSGDASGFRALCLLPADDGSSVPVVVEWGRSPSGGTGRRVTALDGTLLSSSTHPAAWGPLALRYRGFLPSIGPSLPSGSSGSPARSPIPLGPSVDSWRVPDSPADPPSLPAVVEAHWCGFDLSLPVPCAAPPSEAAP